MSKLQYVEAPNTGLISLQEGAKSAGVTYARFRGALKRLGIPIHRVGWGILVDRACVSRVRKAMKDGTIKRGRKKKGETE